MAKFLMTELVGVTTFTARVSNVSGDVANGAGSIFTDVLERGKFMKLAADSRYVMAAVGDEIETILESVNTATQDGFSIAALRDCVGPAKFMMVTFDGLQGTPGAGAVVIGDYVLVGTPVAKGTALTARARVVKATTQASAKATPFAWRVVSLGNAGTGAVGTVGCIQRVGA